jgi:hypothetical protein
MCVVCRKVNENSITPEQAEKLLEEIQSKISDEHLDEVEDMIAEYYDTYDYGLDEEYMNEEYNDELGADEKQMLREYTDDTFDINDLPDYDDDYEN